MDPLKYPRKVAIRFNLPEKVIEKTDEFGNGYTPANQFIAEFRVIEDEFGVSPEVQNFMFENHDTVHFVNKVYHDTVISKYNQELAKMKKERDDFKAAYEITLKYVGR